MRLLQSIFSTFSEPSAISADFAVIAVGLLRLAPVPPVTDDKMGEFRQIFCRNIFVDEFFYFLRLVIVNNAKPVHNPVHVGVNRKTGNPERIAKHDIRCLSANAWQFEKFLHATWNLT